MLYVKDLLFIFLSLQGILSLIVSHLIIFSVRYFLSFIIIYEKGVVVREKSIFKFWKRSFITFEEIEGIELGVTSTWMEPAVKEFIKKLIIRVKGKKDYQISASWVKDVKRVKKLLMDSLDKYYS